MTALAQAVRALEAAEDAAGYEGHTDERHLAILAATESVRAEVERVHHLELEPRG